MSDAAEFPVTQSSLPDRSATCRICGASSGTTHVVREMMFGTGDVFHYFACDSCECVQLVDPPDDLARYYPSGYYSYAPPRERTGLRGAFRRRRNRGTFAGSSGISNGLDRLLARALPYPIFGASSWMTRLDARRDSRILDVGSGSGALLLDLASAGYTDLTGADPFIAHDVRYPNGVRILKKTAAELTETFDVIMLHHAFEHVADPDRTLRTIAQRLAPDGACLIRIPTSASWAWEHYREHWVQLDAPRHFFIHSRRSMALLAERAGLALVDVVFDSTDFQFAGSELYQRNRSLADLHSSYSKAQTREFRRRAAALNREERGDQAAFYFRRRANMSDR